MTYKRLHSTVTIDGKILPIFTFLDEYGRTIVQAVGEHRLKLFKKYFHEKGITMADL